MPTCTRCDLPTTGKSKYCPDHAKEARRVWRERVATQTEERDKRYSKFANAYATAKQLAYQAGLAAKPTPMVVAAHADQLDDNSPVVEQWNVPDGPCGFAWVNIRPGNCSFARWLVKQGICKGKAYYGGVDIWISEFGQSYERKHAAAQAMAEHLKAELGVKAYASGRLD